MGCPPPPEFEGAAGPGMSFHQLPVKSAMVAPNLTTPVVFAVSELYRATTFDPARQSTAMPVRLPLMLLFVKAAARVFVGEPNVSPFVRMPAPVALAD